MESYFSDITTEEINPATARIDECSTEEILRLINNEDKKVPTAVESVIPEIVKAVDFLFESLSRGGRMFYIGAGTSGRLGVLDASECPPTYGTDPELVQGFIAGGDKALRTAIEGCEDNEELGFAQIGEAGVRPGDTVIGITASGSARFVIGALKAARELGCVTIGVVNNEKTKLEGLCDVCIAPVVGPEVVMGSTRMKAGTAQKLVLNMLTTSVMIKLGKVYGNMMVDLRASNNKLNNRAKRIVMMAAECDEESAVSALEKAGGNAKLAILIVLTGLEAGDAQDLLIKNRGYLKAALKEAKTL
ncbi:MAG: N-acetylmuramic acid 6-phosphate etherase [Lachnospiraceae bacterium]|nr:N-acetylmuramic acid 6-phosphate etherase [Lachnospiraceae bacterium]